MMKTKRVGIYSRVSLQSQDTSMQERELGEFAASRGWLVTCFKDRGQSGAKASRPALDELLQAVRRRRVDVVLVWSLDRLARSLKQLLLLAEEFQTLGVDLISIRQNIDTSIPSGRLTFQVLGAVAEFERELLRERVRAGVAHARQMGKQLGRPALKKLTSSEAESLRAARAEGKSYRALAEQFGTTIPMAFRVVKEGFKSNHS